jgi:hypothetical protein
LSILALLDDNPLSHEPAYERGTLLDSKHRDYADAVEHNMIKLTVETINNYERDKNAEHHPWFPFQDVLEEQLPQMKKILARKVQEKAKSPEKLWAALSYNMQIRSFWRKMIADVPWLSTTNT